MPQGKGTYGKKVGRPPKKVSSKKAAKPKKVAPKKVAPKKAAPKPKPKGQWKKAIRKVNGQLVEEEFWVPAKPKQPKPRPKKNWNIA